mmetsp:Transcript_14407/g.18940  ORF Transcript_14407/g.18940 Transcript_14407/m.18940 type:complete len:317 (+) Transcript_14407:216-1166(+)|eukprot:CAMPEP_0184017234 /NCGR_PEP_ID=MMETSP0954-20121128/7406_1 /TAXON_ID=627963 /ORGANISM="Aplanochytrium sp, Strain PBS07" /LENGTH=316 /DNA_ID=CAMNT_0026298413 /DNA_START=137 /DNA_END=1087 /DNA_ORIENTATION=+
MADVTALFASRKSKKGKKKKKAKNATKLMEEQEIKAAPEVVVEEEEERVLELGGDLDQGNWVESDEEEDLNKNTNFLMGGTTKELADLDIEEYNRQLKGEDPKDEVNDFQWSQNKQEESEAAPETEETPVEPEKKEPEEPQVYRPRQVMASIAKASGNQVLKQLDNEEVFPTLGGAPTKKAPANAWGVSAPKPKKPKAVYLGSDFIAAAQSEGEKPGYRFGPGENGSGYYWEGPTRVKEKALKKAAAENPSKEPETKAEPEKKAEPEPVETKPAADEGEKSTPSAPAVFESSADRFADLAKIKKKKKKKKKKAVEE